MLGVFRTDRGDRPACRSVGESDEDGCKWLATAGIASVGRLETSDNYRRLGRQNVYFTLRLRLRVCLLVFLLVCLIVRLLV